MHTRFTFRAAPPTIGMAEPSDRPEGDITRRARRRWRDELPRRDNVDKLTWLAVKKVLWPMLREMADEAEAQRAEIEELRAEVEGLRTRGKGRDS